MVAEIDYKIFYSPSYFELHYFRILSALLICQKYHDILLPLFEWSHLSWE